MPSAGDTRESKLARKRASILVSGRWLRHRRVTMPNTPAPRLGGRPKAQSEKFSVGIEPQKLARRVTRYGTTLYLVTCINLSSTDRLSDKAWPLHPGGIATTPYHRAAAWDNGRRRPGRSSCQAGCAAPLRAAKPPAWRRIRQCTNMQAGPVAGGRVTPRSGAGRNCRQATMQGYSPTRLSRQI